MRHIGISAPFYTPLMLGQREGLIYMIVSGIFLGVSFGSSLRSPPAPRFGQVGAIPAAPGAAGCGEESFAGLQQATEERRWPGLKRSWPGIWGLGDLLVARIRPLYPEVSNMWVFWPGLIQGASAGVFIFRGFRLPVGVPNCGRICQIYRVVVFASWSIWVGCFRFLGIVT